jgi:hypothetical protein
VHIKYSYTVADNNAEANIHRSASAITHNRSYSSADYSSQWTLQSVRQLNRGYRPDQRPRQSANPALTTILHQLWTIRDTGFYSLLYWPNIFAVKTLRLRSDVVHPAEPRTVKLLPQQQQSGICFWHAINEVSALKSSRVNANKIEKYAKSRTLKG